MFKTIKEFFKTVKADESPTNTIPIHHCVQCHKKIRGVTELGWFPVCIQPDCPNYGIMQVGKRHVKEFIKSLKTKTK